MGRLRAVALRARSSSGRGDEGLTLLYVMVFIMLITSLIFFLMAQILSEAQQTMFDRKHTQTLNSASAGLQAATNLIRNAIDPVTGVGLLTALPCQGTNKGTITGPVDGAGALTYSADIYYLSTDPSTMTQAQVVASAMTCGQVLSTVPAFAYILASGTQAALPGSVSTLGNRSLHAVYVFSTSNAAGIGGQVTYTNIFGVQVCWDAGASPAVGSSVTFQVCGPTGTLSQSWYYRPDLTVQWMGDPTRKLCLQRSASLLALPLPTQITLQTCLGPGTLGKAYDPVNNVYSPAALQYQEFPTQDSWAIANADGSRNDSFCITSLGFPSLFSIGAPGDLLVVAPALDCVSATPGAARAAATPLVGAGAASGVTNGLPGVTQQIANLAYANRCLDVKNSVTSGAAMELISYTCGQSPDYTKVPGNKRYQFIPSAADPAKGQFLTLANTPAQAAKCFEPSGVKAITLPCVTGRAEQQWNLTGFISGDYANSYTIRDYLGRCLTAGVPNQRYGTIGPTTLETCTGADTQKWNAPPGGAQTQLRDYLEN